MGGGRHGQESPPYSLRYRDVVAWKGEREVILVWKGEREGERPLFLLQPYEMWSRREGKEKRERVGGEGGKERQGTTPFPSFLSWGGGGEEGRKERR